MEQIDTAPNSSLTSIGGTPPIISTSGILLAYLWRDINETPNKRKMGILHYGIVTKMAQMLAPSHEAAYNS